MVMPGWADAPSRIAAKMCQALGRSAQAWAEVLMVCLQFDSVLIMQTLHKRALRIVEGYFLLFIAIDMNCTKEANWLAERGYLFGTSQRPNGSNCFSLDSRH
jgi:hypothetical protein